MFWEYARLLGLSGESPVTFEFVIKMLIIAGSAALLVLVGFKIKGVWGAVLALLVGTALFLYLKG